MAALGKDGPEGATSLAEGHGVIDRSRLDIFSILIGRGCEGQATDGTITGDLCKGIGEGPSMSGSISWQTGIVVIWFVNPICICKCGCIGESHTKQGELEKGQAIQQSLAIGERDRPDVAFSVNSPGLSMEIMVSLFYLFSWPCVLHFSQEARELGRRALAPAGKSLGPNHPNSTEICGAHTPAFFPPLPIFPSVYFTSYMVAMLSNCMAVNP